MWSRSASTAGSPRSATMRRSMSLGPGPAASATGGTRRTSPARLRGCGSSRTTSASYADRMRRSSTRLRSRTALRSITDNPAETPFGSGPMRAVAHHLEVADDAGERCPQLVGDGRDEGVLGAVELLEPMHRLALLLEGAHLHQRGHQVVGEPGTDRQLALLPRSGVRRTAPSSSRRPRRPWRPAPRPATARRGPRRSPGPRRPRAAGPPRRGRPGAARPAGRPRSAAWSAARAGRRRTARAAAAATSSLRLHVPWNVE